MYVSTTTWRDLTDGHLYHSGDTFPFDGREIQPDRLDKLESGRNQAGLQLIRQAVQKEETPQEPKPARKRTRAKK